MVRVSTPTCGTSSPRTAKQTTTPPVPTSAPTHTPTSWTTQTATSRSPTTSHSTLPPPYSLQPTRQSITLRTNIRDPRGEDARPAVTTIHRLRLLIEIQLNNIINIGSIQP